MKPTLQILQPMLISGQDAFVETIYGDSVTGCGDGGNGIRGKTRGDPKTSARVTRKQHFILHTTSKHELGRSHATLVIKYNKY